MRLATNYMHTRLLLKNTSDRRNSGDTKDWVKGMEPYYIQCVHSFRKGFLCIKQRESYHSSGRSEEEIRKKYKVCIKGPDCASREEDHLIMLFRLHPIAAPCLAKE